MPATLAGFAEDIERRRQDWHVPGCAVAVIEEGEVIFSRGFGSCREGEATPITPKTLFPIASATKPFTAHSLAILVEKGILNWDTPLQQYWPEFRLFDPVASNRLTVRDLLCHRSGLSRHDLLWYQSPLSRLELMERLRYLEPSKDFRSAYQYQNLMYAAAGYLVERLTGLPWETFVREKILLPLGMNNSCFSLREAGEKGMLAHPYMRNGERVTEVPFLNNEAIGPAGSMIATLEDMCKWLRFQLQPDNSLTNAGESIMSAYMQEELRAPQIAVGPYPATYPEVMLSSAALGWFVQAYRGERMVYHAGNLQGFSSLISFLPDKKCGVVVLSQVDNSRLPMIVTHEAYDRVLGLLPVDWHGKLRSEDEKEANERQARYRELQEMKTSLGLHETSILPEKTSNQGCVGMYRHAGYGQISVTEVEGIMHANYNSLSFLLEPIGENRYLATYDETYILCMPMTFQTDSSGEVVSLSAPFEPVTGAKEIMFSRI
ncbi:serine hydrolase [Brevibacillus sp. 179-C9.3 HS]|uniref:serine hydrolase n=1 Tax=unclassified Brevibacillus TaxID=2684853 RepID=UPI0039A3400C